MKVSSLLLLGTIALLSGCQIEKTTSPSSSFPLEPETLSQSINDWFPIPNGQDKVLSSVEEFLLYKSLAHLSQQMEKQISSIIQKNPRKKDCLTKKVISLLPPAHLNRVSLLPYQTQDIQNKLALPKERILTVSEIYETFQALMAADIQDKTLKESLIYYKEMQLLFEKASQKILSHSSRNTNNKRLISFTAHLEKVKN